MCVCEIARSYGTAAVKPKEVIDTKVVPPPWEEPPTFTPALVASPTAAKLRQNAPSNKCARVLPNPPLPFPLDQCCC